VKYFNTLATSLNILHNYFDDQTKLFSDLIYLVKFLDTSTKPCSFRVQDISQLENSIYRK